MDSTRLTSTKLLSSKRKNKTEKKTHKSQGKENLGITQDVYFCSSSPLGTDSFSCLSPSCHVIQLPLPDILDTWHRHAVVLFRELCTHKLENESLCLVDFVSLSTSVPYRVRYKSLVLSCWGLENVSLPHTQAYIETCHSANEALDLQVCSILSTILILYTLSWGH